MSSVVKNALAALTLSLIGVSAFASGTVITCPQTIKCDGALIQHCQVNDPHFYLTKGVVRVGSYVFDNAGSGTNIATISFCSYKHADSLNSLIVGEKDLVLVAKQAGTAYVIPGSNWEGPVCKASSSEACRMQISG